MNQLEEVTEHESDVEGSLAAQRIQTIRALDVRSVSGSSSQSINQVSIHSDIGVSETIAECKRYLGRGQTLARTNRGHGRRRQ